MGLLLAVSLASFEVLGDADNGQAHGSVVGWIVVSVIGIPATAACLAVARTRSGAARAGALALAVGLLGGVLAVLTKSVVDAAAADGIMRLLSNGETYALVVVGVAGIYLQQLAFQAGALQASLPIMTVAEPLIAALLGLTLLHEHVQPGQWRAAVLVACAGLATWATIALARAQSREATAPRSSPLIKV
jgi:threonine/homoserine efflux transporter RhtA